MFLAFCEIARVDCAVKTEAVAVIPRRPVLTLSCATFNVSFSANFVRF